MFEKAARLKLRFNHKGLCTVEDVWDLPLESLDTIFKALNAEFKVQKEESLLAKKTEAEEVLSLKLAIVKHIVEVRLQEKQEREEAGTKASRKQKLLEIISDKQDAALREMSVEDLNKLVNEL